MHPNDELEELRKRLMDNDMAVIENAKKAGTGDPVLIMSVPGHVMYTYAGHIFPTEFDAFYTGTVTGNWIIANLMTDLIRTILSKSNADGSQIYAEPTTEFIVDFDLSEEHEKGRALFRREVIDLDHTELLRLAMYRRSLYKDHLPDMPELYRYAWRMCLEDKQGRLPGEEGYVDHYGELNSIDSTE